MQITNFGGNVSFLPDRYFEPRSEDEVLQILADCRSQRMRVIGRLHSWSPAPGGDEVVLNLRHLDQVTWEDRNGRLWVTAGAGCQVKRIVAQLEQNADATLPSLGLIDEQTIAGATATGTHGSGKHSLSHYVAEVRVATYDPDSGEPVVKVINEGADLLAARCSLGCLGIVLSISFWGRPQYMIEQHFRWWDELDDVLAAEQEFPLQQFYLVPWRWQFLGQHRREVTESRSWRAGLFRAYWFWFVDVGLHIQMHLLAKIIRSRSLLRRFYRRILPWTLICNWRVVDRSQRMLTMQHELFQHIEIEVFVRRSQLPSTLQFVRQLIEHCNGDDSAFGEPTRQQLAELGLASAVDAARGCYTHHYPICIRKVLPDETLISMASSDDKAYYAVSLISYQRPEEREGFFQFARLLAACTARLFAARPHWGKYFPLDAAEVAELYPQLQEFRDIARTYDPEGVFRNEWLEEVVFTGLPARSASE